MSRNIRLAIAGLGTVGIGVLKIIEQHAQMLADKTGTTISVSAISARSRSKDRGIDLSGYAWEDDPVALAQRDDVDVFVELMGGDSGPAKASVEAAIGAGKHVVTANKALLALHGQALAKAAEAAGVNLRYEAAVAGGIPIIKSINEGLAGNTFSRVLGVMNGTCNYILTRMEDAGLPYDEVFEEANQLGYLEADPNLDVGGIDAAHKLAILSAIAFGTEIDFDGIDIEGIGLVTIEDIMAAQEMGYRIKLLGVAQLTENGLAQSMRPCLVPQSSPLGQLSGGTNMVIVEGDSVGQIVLRGAGAGEGPTASAVMGDIMDVARGGFMPVLGRPVDKLISAKATKSDVDAAYYLRVNLKDVAGTMATVAQALAENNVSIDRMRQKSHENSEAPVVIVTHVTSAQNINRAIDAITASGSCLGEPIALRIEAV